MMTMSPCEAAAFSSFGCSTIGPLRRASSGVSHADLPRFWIAPATRLVRRSRISSMAPSVPRTPVATTRTRTRSPCIAPRIDSSGMKMSSASPSVATKPKPRGCAERKPSFIAPRDSALAMCAARKRFPASGTIEPSNTRSERIRERASCPASLTPKREAISLAWRAREKPVNNSNTAARRGGFSLLTRAS